MLSFVFYSIPDLYETQKMYKSVVSEDPFLIVYCHDKYKNQKMFDKAVNDSLAALKLITDWFVTSQMIKNFLLPCSQMIIYLMKILVMSCFFVMKWVFLIWILIINLDNNFDEDDTDTIILIRLLAWHIKFGKRKELKMRKKI